MNFLGFLLAGFVKGGFLYLDSRLLVRIFFGNKRSSRFYVDYNRGAAREGFVGNVVCLLIYMLTGLISTLSCYLKQ